MKNEENGVVNKLEDFCDASVLKVKDTYNVMVPYVIYDSAYLLKQSSEINGCPYDIIASFSMIVRVLRAQCAPFLMRDDMEGFDRTTVYENAIASFEEKLVDSNCTLGDATKALLTLVNDESLSINSKIFSDIISLLSPVCLAANYFNHKYKGHFLLLSKH